MHVHTRRPGLLAFALVAAALAAAPAPAVAQEAPGARFRARLSERASKRGAAGALGGRFRLRLAGPTTSEAAPSTFGVRVGGLTFDVPLDRGRFSGRVEGIPGNVVARVRWRRNFVTAIVTGRRDESGGAVFIDDRFLPDAHGPTDWGHTLHGLRAASVVHDAGSSALVLGIAGRTDIVPYRAARGLDQENDRYEAALLAAGVPVSVEAGRPTLQLVPPRSGERASGRVRGHAVAAGELSLLGYDSSYGVVARRIVPIDAAAIEIGDGVPFAPGVSVLTTEEGPVYQQRFDFAVQAPPGLQQVTIHARGTVPGIAQVVRNFRVEDPVPPLLVEADRHVLETRVVTDAFGPLWAWGANDFGQIGDGSVRDPVSPVPHANPLSVVALAAGDDFSVAADATGVVWLWGLWERRRLTSGGDLDLVDVAPNRPAPFTSIPGVKALAAGDDHILALDAVGTVWAWGRNLSGQLGDGTTQPRAMTPEPVADLPVIVAIAAGVESSFALDENGEVWSWGDLLLDGSGTLRPVRVRDLPPIVAIAADEFAAALDEDGGIWAWGPNDRGQLGSGTFDPSLVPVRVLVPGDATAIDAGGSHGIALTDDGEVWTWGANSDGELGVGSRDDRAAPVQVADLEGVASVRAGATFSIAVETDGTVRLWGGLRPEPRAPAPAYPVIVPREFRRGHYAPGTFDPPPVEPPPEEPPAEPSSR